MVSNTDTRDRTDDKDKAEKSNNNSGGAAERVVSDRRARAKAKRGESFVKVDEATVAGETQKKDRPTPSRRNAPKGAPRRNIFQRIPVVRPIYNYFDASAEEMRKVTWPTREETVRLTRMVLALMIVASIVLGVIDLFYGWWFRQALDNETLFLLLGVGVSIVGAGFAYIVFVQRDEYSAY
jgi:preprotein translocase SecE subunit